MKRGKFFELEQSEIEPFFAQLGKQLFSSLPISQQLDHSHPVGTIADYYRVAPGESRVSSFATEFLVDFMSSVRGRGGTGQTLSDEWLGDKEVLDIANRVFQKNMFELLRQLKFKFK